MTIYDVPISDIAWTTWWMLGSALLTLVGFVGWQIGKFITGARVIAENDDTTPRYGWLRARMLPGYLANRPFKGHVAARQMKGPVGRLLFNLMLFGLAAHVGFWVYAANVMTP
ncbi:hypothetical protein [Marinovum sp.]|uniref:hypothetical protein n=1 Tax=Marinovum sp. TaxID=2024839 RepID=UPI003A952957